MVNVGNVRILTRDACLPFHAAVKRPAQATDVRKNGVCILIIKLEMAIKNLGIISDFPHDMLGMTWAPLERTHFYVACKS